METEIWKDIPWYEWLYKASNLWRIKSLFDRNHGNFRIKILKKYKKIDWYEIVNLYNWNNKKCASVHRLVASTFHWLDLLDPKQFACHKNDTPDDNRECNIFVWTAKDNFIDMCNKWRKVNNNKIVLQYSLDMEFIKEWNSTLEIQRILNFHNSCISKCCNNTQKVSHWFIWKYKY